ncbi:unnamed protein product [Cylicocyclus nassatus]|uniref:Uncharacterized protein n=1 Tax=Cylicocyclus nassatus TaxID=53992 RepID=A0AA36HCB9_CYLNA|nr:unnamed protein product [Cylicocyclus nassatus]
MTSEFNIKSCKQRLTRQLNELANMIDEANTFKEPWQYPTNADDILQFILANTAILRNLINQMKTKEDQIMAEYSNQARALEAFKSINTEYGENLEKEFDSYWENKRADESLDISVSTRRKLETRIVELECQQQALEASSMRKQSSKPSIQETTQRCTSLFQAMEDHQQKGINQTLSQSNQTTADLLELWCKSAIATLKGSPPSRSDCASYNSSITFRMKNLCVYCLDAAFDESREKPDIE